LHLHRLFWLLHSPLVHGFAQRVQEEVFKLQHLLDANLLKWREDVEDLASAAIKEKQIEVKLGALHADWAIQSLTFNEHKSRGAVVIKPSDYAELVEKLEESQMNLSSMATNRYSKPFEAQVRRRRPRALFCASCSALRHQLSGGMSGCRYAVPPLHDALSLWELRTVLLVQLYK
jgi:Dynein heavy chain, N-terminal region 2